MWIEARERGERAGDHPRAAAYHRLGLAIGGLPDFDGGRGWERALLDQLALPDARAVAAARRRRRRLAAGMAVAGAALAALLVLKLKPRPDAPVDEAPAAAPSLAPSLTARVERGPDARRSDVAAIGDVLRFEGVAAGNGELWVYGAEQLVLRCPGGDGCAVESIEGGRRIQASVRASAALRYTGVIAPEGVTPRGTFSMDTALPGIGPTRTLVVR